MSEADSKPARIGRFQIVRQLGRGATATVYLAHDPHHDRQVALKVIKFGGELEPGEARIKQHRRLRKLFQTEGAVAARLDHPNIVKVYDTVVDQNTALMAMEYVEGTTLAEFCTFDRLLPLPRVVGIIFKCCLAIDYAYRQGVVHRDIKPANIMVGPDDNPKIMDFGLALNMQKQSEHDSTFVMGVGSPAYMSPEQVKGYALNQQTDLYSLGVVLFMMLTGRVPFRAKHYPELIYKIINSDAPSVSALNPVIPPELDPIVKRALEKDLYSRYKTGADFGKDLAGARYQLKDEETEKLSDRFELLRSLPVFAQFERVELWEVLRIATWHHFDDGAALMEEGDETHTFGVLIAGEVEVSRDRRVLARLGPGEVLGEMAFLNQTHPVRTATVVAMGDVTFLEVNLAAYEIASEECKEHFQSVLIDALIRRLHSANAVVSEHAAPARAPVPSMMNLELVPADGTGGDLEAIAWPGRSSTSGYGSASASASNKPDPTGSFASAANSTFAGVSRTMFSHQTFEPSAADSSSRNRTGGGS
ncbi:MAG: protein kinase domain-containing protein [bacterium]